MVIPTLDEGNRLSDLLNDLESLTGVREVVVVDGGSEDDTVAKARRAGAVIVESPRGRAGQLNAGAKAATAPWLLFLHADSRLPRAACLAVEQWLEGATPDAAAAFGLRFDEGGWRWRVLEWGQRIRQHLTGIPYGDQGLLVGRQLFEAVGGYPEQPLMEDVEIIRRLRKRGSLTALPAPLLTSPRRYQRDGIVWSVLRNTTLLLSYLVGVDSRRLARWYQSEPTPGTDRTLPVFAKAPSPGRVKTRLAADLGAERAGRR